MTLPYWADDDASAAAWNTVQLGPVTLPGICTVTADKGRDVDVKKSKGQDGASMTDNGATPGKVSIVLQLPDRASWVIWQKIRPSLDPNRAGGTKSPLGIQHPACASCGIKDIYVKLITQSSPTARTGMTVTLDCLEWFPKPKPSKGASAKTKASKPAERNSIIGTSEGQQTNAGQDFVKDLTGSEFGRDVGAQNF